MLAAWAAIAGALAEMVAAERFENGRVDSSPADVWGHLQREMSPDNHADLRAPVGGSQPRESDD